MNILLGENIRKLRKSQGLTQEQLAEVLGVTPGAVYKWEAKLSVPDINLIIELASFFDTSVDVLLGYDIKGKSRTESIALMKQYSLEHNKDCLSEAEKALTKYPNFFDVVFESASCYHLFGISLNDKAMLRRGIELYNRSLSLISQNNDPDISELSICRNLAGCYISLGDISRGIEILKQNNPCYINSSEIGFALASNEQCEEAVTFLSQSLLSIAIEAAQTVTGYINVYFKRKNYSDAAAVINWGLDFLRGLHYEEKNNSFDKISVVFLVCLGEVKLKTEGRAAAKQALLEAKALAERFDSVPNYKIENIRFMEKIKPAAAYDDIGKTAIEGIENTVLQSDDEELRSLWKEICESEK